MSIPTQEEVCAPIINIIKDCKNVTYNIKSVDPTYFINDKEKSELRGPVGWCGCRSEPDTNNYVEIETKIRKINTVIEITVDYSSGLLYDHLTNEKIELLKKCRKSTVYGNTFSFAISYKDFVKVPEAYANLIEMLVK